ncbi:MAG: TonB-dependent receptor, partial [Steroidobacteraceae bacterium]
DGLPGDRLPGSPQKQGNLYFGYDMPLANTWRLGLNYGISYTGDVLTRTGGRGDGETIGGFAVSGASAVLGAEKWSLALYAENLFDKYAVTGVRQNPAYVQTLSDINGDPVAVRDYSKDILRPREIGLRFTYEFDF